MSQFKKYDRSGTRGYAQLAEIDAPAARVWQVLTDVALVRIWYGADAEIDARKGGRYRVGRIGAGGREAHIDIFDVNRRLRLIYMDGSGTPPCTSAIVDDFLLDIRKGAGKTSLRLLGSGIPEAQAWDPLYKNIRLGWERHMARIKAALEIPMRPAAARVKPPEPPLPGIDY